MIIMNLTESKITHLWTYLEGVSKLDGKTHAQCGQHHLMV